MSLLTLERMRVLRQHATVVDDVSLTVSAGELVGLIGPNGAGKTTLMRAALGLLAQQQGRSNLTAMTPDARAKHVAWLPQHRQIAWDMSVRDVVMLGRLPYGEGLGQAGREDLMKVEAALRHMDLAEMANRKATRLSGGEQARLLIARVLAQDTPLIMADEPIAGLDPAHQISTMNRFAELAHGGRGVIVSLHDLGLAARHCTRVVMLSNGRIVADGVPEDVLTAETLRDHFGLRAYLQNTEHGIIFQPLDVISENACPNSA